MTSEREDVVAKINLNQADAEALQALPGIGPELAKRIIRLREEIKAFERPVEITGVLGISERMYNKFADQVTLSSSSVMAATPAPPEESLEPPPPPEPPVETEPTQPEVEEPTPESKSIAWSFADQPVATVEAEAPNLTLSTTVTEPEESMTKDDGYIIETDEDNQAEPESSDEGYILALDAEPIEPEGGEGGYVIETDQSSEPQPEISDEGYVIEADQSSEPQPEVSDEGHVIETDDPPQPEPEALDEGYVTEADDQPPPEPELVEAQPESKDAEPSYMVAPADNDDNNSGGSFWRPWLLMVVGALGGALLALFLISALNGGTLNFNNHPKVIEIESEIEALRSRETVLNQELSELREKLAEYDGLSTRLQNSEAQIEVLKQARDAMTDQVIKLAEESTQIGERLATLEGETSALDEAVNSLQETDQEMQTDIELLQSDTGRFDGFLTDLRDLLLDTQGEPETPTPSATPTNAPTGTPLPTQTPASSSPTPSPSPTPTPTATATPTATPRS